MENGVTATRNVAYYSESDYWYMDVDWFDIDDVVDYLADEVIYCDFTPSEAGSAFADFTEYPWWWGANYCLESMSVTENDSEGVPQTT